MLTKHFWLKRYTFTFLLITFSYFISGCGKNQTSYSFSVGEQSFFFPVSYFEKSTKPNPDQDIIMVLNMSDFSPYEDIEVRNANTSDSPEKIRIIISKEQYKGEPIDWPPFDKRMVFSQNKSDYYTSLKLSGLSYLKTHYAVSSAGALENDYLVALDGNMRIVCVRSEVLPNPDCRALYTNIELGLKMTMYFNALRLKEFSQIYNKFHEFFKQHKQGK